jgi:hypothetical protein
MPTPSFMCRAIVLLLFSVWVSISVAAQGDPYTWPAYSPTLNYNFKTENPNFAMPSKDLDGCTNIAGRQVSDWWAFYWGPNANALVTGAAITPLLARMNKDFAYFRDVMGWPPDARAQKGYRSAIYLYGSGLCTDNASNTDKGGWQSSVGGYPMVLLSYYPVYCFDPACKYTDKVDQQGACVHEGIHSVLAGLPGAKQAAWFQEGGNTWLQQQATAQQTNDYSTMGFLNGTTFIAPFMPIECYSGWLQDGSFGGPSAEGVDMSSGGKQICTWRTFLVGDMSSGGKQICTWRTFLGGNQYGNGFPTFLGEWLGLGSVPWIWKNCPGRVLEGMAAGLGEAQIRRLIMEYRAKQAMLDMKKWSNAFKTLVNNKFGSSIGPEGSSIGMSNWIECPAWKATPYAKTANDGTGLLTPDSLTTPGWSGANQIPLKVAGAMASVEFQPIGANMSCQLCYRAAADNYPVYGAPVTAGTCSLRLDKAAISDVVIAVICNTDYTYGGEAMRKAHYGYRLKLGAGMTVADVNTKWYNVTLPVATEPLPGAKKASLHGNAALAVSSTGARSFTIRYALRSAGDVSVCLYAPSGGRIRELVSRYGQPGNFSEAFDAATMGISSGTYVVQLRTEKSSIAQKAVLAR